MDESRKEIKALRHEMLMQTGCGKRLEKAESILKRFATGDTEKISIDVVKILRGGREMTREQFEKDLDTESIKVNQKQSGREYSYGEE